MCLVCESKARRTSPSIWSLFLIWVSAPWPPLPSTFAPLWYMSLTLRNLRVSQSAYSSYGLQDRSDRRPSSIECHRLFWHTTHCLILGPHVPVFFAGLLAFSPMTDCLPLLFPPGFWEGYTHFSTGNTLSQTHHHQKIKKIKIKTLDSSEL